MQSPSHTTRRLSGQDWDIRESGPSDAESTVLLLPGGMCTSVFFEPIMDALGAAPVHVVAATLPGFGRTPHPADFSVESYASLAGQLAGDVRADIVGGHSLGGNVVLEMAARGEFDGPVLLLSPTFSRADEARELGVLDRLGAVPGVGQLAWLAMLKAIPKAMGKRFPAERRDALVAGMANNDPRFCRRGVRAYFEYLDAHGSLVPRLCQSGVTSYVVFGDNDEIGLTDEERCGLEACADVTLVTVADATHGLIIEQPAQIAELILELIGKKNDASLSRLSRRSPELLRLPQSVAVLYHGLARNPAAGASPLGARQPSLPGMHPWTTPQLAAFLGWALEQSQHHAAWTLRAPRPRWPDDHADGVGARQPGAQRDAAGLFASLFKEARRNDQAGNTKSGVTGHSWPVVCRSHLRRCCVRGLSRRLRTCQR